MIPDKPTITTTEAAAALGVSHDTIARLFRNGELQGYKVTMRRNAPLRIYLESVESFDRQRRDAPQVGI